MSATVTDQPPFKQLFERLDSLPHRDACLAFYFLLGSLRGLESMEHETVSIAHIRALTMQAIELQENKTK